MIEQLSMTFDYAALDAETRIVVQQRTSEIKSLMKRAASDIIDIGQKLIDVKDRLGHGKFGSWLASEFAMTDRTARNFMAVADTFKSETVSDLIAPRALYLLAAPSTPEAARVEAISRAEQGEPITHQAAREIVSTHKQAAPAAPHYIELPAPAELPFVPTAADYQDFYGDEDPELWEAHQEPEVERVAQSAPVELPVMTAPRINAGLFTSATPEWYTPKHVIARVSMMWGRIDLDPCSNSNDPETASVPALHYFTQADNGLAQPWHGNVYMNPPYGDVIGNWVERLCDAYASREIDEGIALLPARVDTGWFQSLFDHTLCFVRGRLKFSGAENSAPFPSVLVYFGTNVSRFAQIFSELGPIMVRMQED